MHAVPRIILKQTSSNLGRERKKPWQEEKGGARCMLGEEKGQEGGGGDKNKHVC